MSTHRHKTHPLTVLHIVAMVGLLVWWSFYFWHHSPVREMLQARQTAADVARAPVGGRPQMPRTRKASEDFDHRRRTAVPTLGRAAADSLENATERASAAVNAALTDVARGLFEEDLPALLYQVVHTDLQAVVGFRLPRRPCRYA